MIRAFVENTAWILFANTGQKLFGFAKISVLTFFLVPGELGLFGAVLATLTSVYLISDFGSRVIVQRDCARLSPEKAGLVISAGLLIVLTATLTFATIFLVGRGFFENYVFKNDISTYYWIVPILIVAYSVSRVPFPVFEGLSEFKQASLRNLVIAVVEFVGVIAGVWLGGIEGAFLGLLTAYILSSLYVYNALVRILRKHQVKLRVAHIGCEIKRMIKTGVVFYVGKEVPPAVMGVFIVYIFNTYLGYDDYGYLRTGWSLVGIMSMIPMAIQPVTITYISKYGKGANAIKSLQIRFITIGVVVISLMAVIFIRPIAGLIFDTEYINGIYIYKTLLLVYILHILNGLINGLLVGQGYMKYSGLVGVLQAILYALVMLWLVPIYGVSGYFIAFATSYAVSLSFLVYKEFRGSTRGEIINYLSLMILTVGVVILVLLVGLMGFGWATISLQVLCVMGYFGLGYHYILLTREKEYMKAQIKRVYSKLLSRN